MVRPSHLLAVSCLALALVMSACGSGAASRDETLDVWAWGIEGEQLKELVPRFEAEHPGIQVRITSVPNDALRDKLITSIAGGHAPDVSMFGTTWMAEFARFGALDPVPADIDRGQFLPGAAATGVVDGQVLGVPWYVETRVLYYRTDIARRAGISRPPRTWLELKAMARAMQSEGRARYGIYLGTSNWLEFLPFVWQAGGDELRLDSPEATAAMAFYKSFIDEGLAPASTRLGFDIAPAFIRGTHPMFFSGPWQMDRIRAAAGPAFDRRWAVAPVPRHRTGTSFVGGANWGVLKGTRHREAAWTFVKWLAEPRRQAEWFAVSKSLPANRAAWRLRPLVEDARVRVFGAQLKHAKAPKPTADWERISQAMEVELDVLLRSPVPADQAAKQLEASVRAATAE